jgi:hypothetical protein
VACEVPEVVVCGQHDEAPSDAERCEQRIDRLDLHATSSTSPHDVCRVAMVLESGANHGGGSDAVEQFGALAWTTKALEELLYDEARRDDGSSVECLAELTDLSGSLGLVSPEGHRPHAGVDEEHRQRKAL